VLLTIVGAALALVAVAAPWWARYVIHDGHAVPMLPATGGSVVAGEFPCPPTLADDEYPGGPDELPEGPIAVRACPASELVVPRVDVALTTGLDDLVALVNGQQDQDLDGECPDDDGLSYQLSFQYADGSVQSVEGNLYGCQFTTVGGRQRVGADQVWAAYVDLLVAQGGKTPAASLPAGACWPADSSIRSVLTLWLTPSDYGAGAVCVLEGRELRSAPLPAGLVNRITAREPEEPGSCADARSTAWAVVATSWSDLLSVEIDCLTPYGDRLRAIVENAKPVPIPAPDASTPPEIVALTLDQLRATGHREAAAGLWVEPDAADLAGSMCGPYLLRSLHADVDGWEFAVWVDSSCDNGLGWTMVRDATTDPWRILRYGAAD